MRGMRMIYKIAAHSDVGIVKKTNQDSVLVKIAQTNHDKVCLCVVCDGMGGLADGELASATVIREFDQWFINKLPGLLETPEFPMDELRVQWDDLVMLQNKKLAKYASGIGTRMGTTVVAFLVVDDKYYIMNIGDSRAYMVSDAIYQLTKDQTYVQYEMDKELAKKWFGIVAQAVLSDDQLKAFSLDSTEKLSADKIQEYDIDTNLVETFLSICSYYGKVGQEDTVTGEIKYSYSDFWVELNGLVGGLPETISTESRERLTQLRLLNDVSYQLYENAKQFVSDAGVDKATFQGALAAIETRVSGADTGSNQTAQRIRDNTITTVDNTKKLVESLYAQNSDAVKSGGDQ